ncbi:hypothetical protein fugu_008599 [Takifugu bimaculatus]|uniref:Gem-associated protein 5 TPR domain-containing protein n=1 Tax=Takifugu bimaculatus TaxID=433685 RepID=A0A4Z2AWA7_9TELE|nr:hypothetical protein fugu_008599 [Takifugu bimaculatus]
MNGEPATEGQVGPEEVPGEDEPEEVSSGNGSVPSGNGSKRLISRTVRAVKLTGGFWIPVPVESQTKVSAVVKSRDKHGAAADLLKKKKPRSLLPVSTSMDHRPKEDMLQDCIVLASITHDKAPPAGCVPGQGEHIHLGLFSDRKALHSMFEAEEEAHLEAGHYDSVTYLRLWTGDLEGALQQASERGELNDHLLSLAPMGGCSGDFFPPLPMRQQSNRACPLPPAGFETWRRTVEAFVKQLCLQEQYLKAGVPPAVHQQAVRGRGAAALPQALQGGHSSGQSQASSERAPPGGALHELGRGSGEGRAFLRSS